MSVAGRTVRAMIDLWITVGVPAVVAVATALYTTGGRAALSRRAIQQDLQIARALPAGPAREAAARMAEERTVLYAGRWVGPKKPTLRLHLLHLAFSGGGLLLAWGGGWISDAVEGNLFLASVSLLLVVIGLGAAVGVFVAWSVLIVTSDNAQTRADSISRGRQRLKRHLDGDPHGATEAGTAIQVEGASIANGNSDGNSKPPFEPAASADESRRADAVTPRSIPAPNPTLDETGSGAATTAKPHQDRSADHSGDYSGA